MQSPKVSICIPAYKQVDYLRRTLESVRIQTYQDYEIIITDDSPDDGVAELVKTFDFGDKLKYFRNPVRLGSPENWNEGVRRASGEYIKLLHHDDWFTHENSLLEFASLLDGNPNAGFAFSAAVVRYATDGTTRNHQPTQEQLCRLKSDINSLFLGNFIGPPSSTIYRKKINIQYDARLVWLVDIDFYIRALQVNPHYAYSSNPLMTSTTAADHQITRYCENNKCLEAFEYLYIYNKLKIKKSISGYRPVLKFLLSMLDRYKINTVADVRECGLGKKEIAALRLLLFVKRFKMKQTLLYV